MSVPLLVSSALRTGSPAHLLLGAQPMFVRPAFGVALFLIIAIGKGRDLGFFIEMRPTAEIDRCCSGIGWTGLVF